MDLGTRVRIVESVEYRADETPATLVGAEGTIVGFMDGDPEYAYEVLLDGVSDSVSFYADEVEPIITNIDVAKGVAVIFIAVWIILGAAYGLSLLFG